MRPRAIASLLGVLAASTAAWAGRPIPPTRFSDGLPVAAGAKAGAEVAVLRARPSGRVRIPGATFVMGSTVTELEQAVALCETQPYGGARLVDDFSGNSLSVCDPRAFVEGPAHDVTLSPFEIDRTEVRVADYARCVSAGACSPPGFSTGDPRFDRPDLPVVLVSWNDARDYCGWVGARLPTEAEWEYTARGVGRRVFPWGNVFNGHLCNHGMLARDPTNARDGFAGLAPVGSFPDGATPLGIQDMAGNASEWVADTARVGKNGSTERAYLPQAQTNPLVSEGVMHVVRGGSYLEGPQEMRTAARNFLIVSARREHVGFRCAASVR